MDSESQEGVAFNARGEPSFHKKPEQDKDYHEFSWSSDLSKHGERYGSDEHQSAMGIGHNLYRSQWQVFVSGNPVRRLQQEMCRLAFEQTYRRRFGIDVISESVRDKESS